jgi:prepilin-type N-terminal cleavage/methylation domain-containing protein
MTRLKSRIFGPGFTLVEMAVVLAIVGLLLGSLMYTLSGQAEQRNFEETRRRLEQARELLLAFAIVNGRLPCPARSNSGGAEVRNATGECKDAANVQDYYGGTLAGGVTGGLLPAVTIGYQQTDSDGFALDAWQQRIRYAVARTVANCSGTNTLPHFSNATNLKANGISCQSNDLLICKSAAGLNPGASPPSCGGGGANAIMSTGLVVATVFSTGKNAATGGTGADESTNLKANASLSPLINPLFVYHSPAPSAASGGEFDDQFTWITVGELYGKLIAAGVLP